MSHLYQASRPLKLYLNNLNLVFSWNLKTNQWQTLNPLSEASMDHRGLLAVDESYYLLGGMSEKQTVHGNIIRYQVTENK